VVALHIGEAENCAGRSVPTAPDRFWQGVIGAMREGIAVDDQQWPARRLTPQGWLLFWLRRLA
jgi:hypothetical protein